MSAAIEARSRPSLPGPARLGSALALAILLGLLAGGLALAHGGFEDGLALALAFGTAFGLVLQRSRFCFYCALREWLDEREPDGILGLLAALASGAVGYALVFGAWLPDPATGRLPPDAFIGSLAWTLGLGGLAFGAGMAISGSCLSAHLYRLGEGSPTAPFALFGALIGFALGFASWNPLFLAFVSEAPTVWLPAWLGYPGWLAATLIVIAALAWPALLRASPRRAAARDRLAALAADAGTPALKPLRAVFAARWPGWLGGLFVGAIGAFAYLRVAPLGVTAELSARARDLGTAAGLVPATLNGLDALRGCVSIAADMLLSNNGVFVLSLVAASLASALAAGEFRPRTPRRSEALRGVLGGVLLGWGAMVALGCSVGTLLSGIHAGALSGWAFGAAMIAGIVVWRALERLVRRGS
ncbi:YeeE/YedE family protein [Antarcticirhabdus aurantiaca]|uniref:YeeE/YedE family protein n=1 Tax=Antarcticirhabdus aurantiaca TaxID=2606717 RepID=A0ACD4NLW0_9HYPH|nr:YeeE/YedE family protein [Antarcticirhabdus aurantiaca]WAJ27843.1 YeeE/YedE family protein [Jeongeuplla avenae]